MLKCASCGSTKFTKESNYLICEYCGTKREIDPLVSQKDKTPRRYSLVAAVVLMGVGIYFTGGKGEHPLEKKTEVVSEHMKKSEPQVQKPKISVLNDSSNIGTQVIQTTDALGELAVKNRHSTIDVQVIQSRKEMEASSREQGKRIHLSTETTRYNSKGEVVEHTKRVSRKRPDTYIDKEGIKHTTVYTKLPKVDYRKGHLRVDNSGIEMERQQVSFYVDEKGVKHYHTLTKGISE